MTAEELKEVVETLRRTGGDRRAVEAKRAERALPQRLRETLSAFSNSPGGGTLLLGLAEEEGFRAVGVKEPKKIQSDLASACDQMEPPVRALIELHKFEGVWIVVAEIPEVEEKPCYYKGAGMWEGSFIRVADGDRRLTPYEVHLMWEKRRRPHHDRSPVYERGLGDLDKNLLGSFLERVRRSPRFHGWTDEEILSRLQVVVRDANGRFAPTLAGYLVFGQYPQDLFPGLHLSVVRYPFSEPGAEGLRGERLLDNVKAEGSIPKLLREAIGAVLRNLQARPVVRGLLREDVPEYPLEFLREAIVNALAHRDYSSHAQGTPVQVRIFPDRIEIENPGGLYGPVTLDRLGEPGLMATRNENLLRILEDLPVDGGRMVCENRGTGIATMLQVMREAGLPPPKFEDRVTTFLVVARNATLVDPDTGEWLNRIGQHTPLTEAQRLGLAYLRQADRLTNADFRRLSPRLELHRATQELADLVRKGLLEPHRARRWTFYTLTDSALAFAAGPARRRDDRREAIINLLSERGALSAEEIARALELGLPAVRRWLRILRDEGKVVPTTASVKSRYVRYRASAA